MQGPKLVSQLQRRVAHMITNPVPPDEIVRRHRITPEETEEHIQGL